MTTATLEFLPYKHRWSASTHRLCGFLLLILLQLAPVVSLAQPEVSLTFSSKKEGAMPVQTNETEFTCSDTIFILMHTQNLKPGVLPVEIQWIGPTRKRHELTRFEVYADQQESLIWAWLRLHPPSGTTLTRSFDPSYGMRTFIGKWAVKVLFHGKSVATGNFDVLC